MAGFLAAFALGDAEAPAAAAPRSPEALGLAATVVWVRAPLVYVAATDSGVLQPRLRLVFMERRRTLATGEIERVVDARLAVVRLASGSLDRVKKRERLRILAEPAVLAAEPGLPSTTSLRVGFPAGARTSLLFDCRGAEPGEEIRARGYQADASLPGLLRLTRMPTAGRDPNGPDTLLVRQFGEAADEEIALERGEIDVAVFWPGETSARIRKDGRWNGGPPGLRSRGLLAAARAGNTGEVRGDSVLDALNLQVFGGDLLPWTALDSIAPAAGSSARAARYRVDSAMPGHKVIERFLSRAAAPDPGGRDGETEILYLDAPLAGRDSLRAAWRAQGITPLYALRCPVLCAAPQRALVAALGADLLANLLVCRPAGPPR